MINRPTEGNDMNDIYEKRDRAPRIRDLDMSDVMRDAEDQREAYIERLSERLDGADLHTVLSIIADHTGDPFEVLLNSALGRELLFATQSNPDEAAEVLINLHNATEI